ncbi:MAG TPA: cytochrome c oxidase assembly protein [Gaiellaceae bacterium]|nr:cytochrome c oxidase assembly protein [Gaiellaceae bacterium]
MARRLKLALLGTAGALGLAAVSPWVDELADAHLSVHMLEHVVIGDLAPALVAVALAARIRRLPLPGAAPSFVLWAAAFALWHLPAAYDLAEAHLAVHLAEHASFVAAGLLAWSQLVRLPPVRGILFAVGMLMAGMLLTTALLAPYHAVYEAYPSFRDQQLAALLMTCEQLLTLGTYVAIRVRLQAAAENRPVHAEHPFAA